MLQEPESISDSGLKTCVHPAYPVKFLNTFDEIAIKIKESKSSQ